MLLHLAGGLVCLGVVASQAARLRRLVRESDEVRHGKHLERFSQLAGSLSVRRLPRLYTNPQVESPFSCGIVRPAIVLPVALAESMRRDEIDLVPERGHGTNPVELAERRTARLEERLWRDHQDAHSR